MAIQSLTVHFRRLVSGGLVATVGLPDTPFEPTRLGHPASSRADDPISSVHATAPDLRTQTRVEAAAGATKGPPRQHRRVPGTEIPPNLTTMSAHVPVQVSTPPYVEVARADRAARQAAAGRVTAAGHPLASSAGPPTSTANATSARSSLRINEAGCPATNRAAMARGIERDSRLVCAESTCESLHTHVTEVPDGNYFVVRSNST
jgi:hypothetical protein